jgi:hypothetical protein
VISLVLPYWARQEAADAGIRSLEACYPYLDLEVIVVDDGNPIPFRAPDTRLALRVVRLPEKREPKCPCTAWNAGAAAARGNLLALSCIEILHTEPVLDEMARHVRELGPKGYVLASAWCPETRIWHCHSTVSVPDCPPGSGIAFLGMMRKSLFNRVGGFSEDYREGAGYEDRDLIHRLHAAGAKFVIRDDLVVTHPKTGATIKWPAGGFERNEAIFRQRWAC